MAVQASSQENHTCKGYISIVCKRVDPLAYMLRDDLMERLKVKGFVCKSEENFDSNKKEPGAIVVMCVKTTNLFQNVNEAIAGLEEKNHETMAVIIMHFNHDGNESQVESSADILKGRPHYNNLGEVLDFTFVSKEDVFVLEMNTDKMKLLEIFLERTLGRNTCGGCSILSSDTSFELDTVQLFCDGNDKTSMDLLRVLDDILLLNGVTVNNSTSINALETEILTIFVTSEGSKKEIAENRLVKDIKRRGFKRAIIVLCKKKNNAEVVVDSKLSEPKNIHIFKLSINSIEHQGEIEDINDVLNDLFKYFATGKSEKQPWYTAFKNWRPSLPKGLPSIPSLPGCSKKLGPVQVYCKRNDQTATDITGDLISQLRNQKFDCNMKDTNDLIHAEPAIVICFKTSRILANVSEGLVDIKNKLSEKKVLIILHLTERDIETVDESGADLLGGYADYRSLGMILDMTYRIDEQKSRFCLNHNTQAFKKLESHLKGIA